MGKAEKIVGVFLQWWEGAKSYLELGNSKLCQFCIYRVSLLTKTPLKVSVYIVNCAEKVLSAIIYLPTYF